MENEKIIDALLFQAASNAVIMPRAASGSLDPQKAAGEVKELYLKLRLAFEEATMEWYGDKK